MTTPVPVPSAARLDDLWKRIGAALGAEGPLPARISEAALAATGARVATLFLRERDAWTRAGDGPGLPAGGEVPEPLPEGIFAREGDLWLPLSAEGETHGLLRLSGMPSDEAPEHAAML